MNTQSQGDLLSLQLKTLQQEIEKMRDILIEDELIYSLSKVSPSNTNVLSHQEYTEKKKKCKETLASYMIIYAQQGIIN